MVDPNAETHAMIDYFEVGTPGTAGGDCILFRDDFNGTLKDGISFLSDTTDARQRFYRVAAEVN